MKKVGHDILVALAKSHCILEDWREYDIFPLSEIKNICLYSCEYDRRLHTFNTVCSFNWCFVESKVVPLKSMNKYWLTRIFIGVWKCVKTKIKNMSRKLVPV